jgi:uncharacterized protein
MKRLLARERPFAYACNACGSCCTDKRITLSPYEIARIAESLGATTREVLEQHTDEGGTVLRFGASGCTFKDGPRCGVHSGRPLACRLYPLGRYVTPDGEEGFVDLSPHPDSKGVYGEDGTVASWIEQQGAAPYIDAAARYAVVARRLFDRLNETEGGDEAFAEVVSTETTIASEWLDVDAVVEEACAERDVPVPTLLEARIAIHLAALESWAG